MTQHFHIEPKEFDINYNFFENITTAIRFLLREVKEESIEALTAKQIVKILKDSGEKKELHIRYLTQDQINLRKVQIKLGYLKRKKIIDSKRIDGTTYYFLTSQ